MNLLKKIIRISYFSVIACFITTLSYAEDEPIIFAGDIDYPPFQSIKNNQPIGINVDILRALSKVMHRDFDIQLMKWSEAQQLLLNEKVDALTEMAYSESRAQLYDFSTQTLLYKYTFFVKKDATNFHKLTEAEGKTIAVTKGGYPFQLMNPNKKIKLLIVSNYVDGFKQLLAGNVDAVAADAWVGAYALEEKRLASAIKFDSRSFAEQPGFIAVKKGNTQLLNEINQGITQLRKDGTIQEIFDKWSGESFVFMTKEKLTRLISTIGFTLAFLIGIAVLIWVHVLRKQVHVKTAELQHAHNNLEAKVKDRTLRLELETADHKRSEEELRESEERFRCIFGQAAVGVARVSLDGTWLEVNDKLSQIVGYSSAELALRTFQELTHPDDLPLDIAYVNKILSGEQETYSMEKRYYKKDNDVVWVNLTVSLTKNANNQPDYYIAIIEDISKRKIAEDDLKYKAFHDGLTGVYNRDWLINFLKNTLQETISRDDTNFALLYLDLDNFKNINDSLGHSAGDELLIETTARLKHCLTATDVLARLSGDEFVVVIQNASTDAVINIAERFIESIARPYTIFGNEVRTGVSIGITPNNSGYLNPSEMLRDSDAAMYHAKAKGKNCYVIFDTAMREKILKRLAIEKGIHIAITDNQFALNYQPILCLESGEIKGCEALIRWHHEELGPISPDEFIPIAESSKLMYSLGKWIIEEAFRQWSEWKKQFSDLDKLQLSINLSSIQFHDEALINGLPDIFSKYGLEGSDIAFEITETAIIQDTELAQSVINKLKILGCEIHLDDFGTGYSSLSHLSEFSIDVIKIDRSFVDKSLVNEKQQRMIKGVINLADKLGIKSTAEGIEHKEQSLMLKAEGCTYGQGYFFSRPLTKEAMEEYLSIYFEGSTPLSPTIP